MKTLIEAIIEKKIPCYFISPHLDDAILSCGNLIAHLGKKTKVSVITVFSSADTGQQTLSAWMFLKQCGVPDAQALFARRRQEDEEVQKQLGVVWHHLGFIDALWRKKKTGRIIRTLGKVIPELLCVYPTYRFHITTGRVSDADNALMNQIEEKIKSVTGDKQDSIIFFPLGLGKHVDHVIVNLIGKRLAGDVVYYSDFPYCLTDTPDEEDLGKRGFQKAVFDETMERKHSLIRLYKSQPLFPNGIPIVPEVYYISKHLL